MEVKNTTLVAHEDCDQYLVGFDNGDRVVICLTKDEDSNLSGDILSGITQRHFSQQDIEYMVTNGYRFWDPYKQMLRKAIDAIIQQDIRLAIKLYEIDRKNV